jgi:crotonobetainyl-CoA:carnitine CoA-transferase CaiB-like acyl-CoA transferase
MSSSNEVLRGVRVLDFGRYVAGPMCEAGGMATIIERL